MIDYNKIYQKQYREKHKEEYKEYMRAYMKDYRKGKYYKQKNAINTIQRRNRSKETVLQK